MTGSGTLGDPYIISDATDLQAVQNDLDAYYELGGDIDASATSTWNAGAGFDPIGTNWSASPFNGDFDGKDYTISDLFINRGATSYVGLFAACYPTAGKPGGNIKNVKLTGVNMTGNILVGALVGDTYSDVENCSSTGAVNGNGALGGLFGYIYGDPTKCWSTCTVTTTGPGDEVGGFCGYNAGAITKCFASGDIVGGDTNDYVGGFAGINLGTIEDAYARGAATGNQWVGGFCGYNSAAKTIDNAYSTGVPTGNNDVGGFCGENHATGVISNSFWDTETSGTVVSDGGTGKLTILMKVKPTFIDAGWDFAIIWSILATYNDGYPNLDNQKEGAGMSINTFTLLELHQKLSEDIGDYIQVATTTNITTNTSIISTNLLPYDYGSSDYFNNWWVYITTGNNIGVERQISDYATTSGTITVRGAALVAETGAVNIRVSRYSRANKKRAIIEGIRNISTDLHRKVRNQELITGNILPPFIWTSSTALYKYATTNLTSITKTTTGGLYWNGKSSALAVASAANGYLSLHSDNYPRLLDLMDFGVDFKCWAQPEVDDNATLVIYTIQAGVKEGEYTADAGTSATQIVDSELTSSTDDYYNGDYVWNATRGLGALVTDYDGATKTLTVAIAGQTNGDIYHISTTQTLTSTTANPASKLTLLELENQALNDDLVEVEFRMKVTTNAKYVYFSPPRVTGKDIREYLLPQEFQVGEVLKVYIQQTGQADDWCDDLHPEKWYPAKFDIIFDGTDKYLQLLDYHNPKRTIRLEGIAPLETLDADTDTVTLDDENIDLLIKQSIEKLWEIETGYPSSQDLGTLEYFKEKAVLDKRRLLISHRMSRPAISMKRY